MRPKHEPLLTPGEVAFLFRVDPKTVSRWAAAGTISSIRTPGGHRRFRRAEIEALLEVPGSVQRPRERDPDTDSDTTDEQD